MHLEVHEPYAPLVQSMYLKSPLPHLVFPNFIIYTYFYLILSACHCCTDEQRQNIYHKQITVFRPNPMISCRVQKAKGSERWETEEEIKKRILMLEGETLLDLLNEGPFITSCHRKATIAHLPPAVTGRSYVISPLHANRMNCTCTTLMQSKTSELNSP